MRTTTRGIRSATSLQILGRTALGRIAV
jgi:hypothetical protein